MCGVCGIVGPAADEAMLDDMLEIMAHRGPDAVGRYARGDCRLGHGRLAIVDLSAAGNQPMCTNDGRLAMVANGEIYNQAKLRRELEAEGHRFSSNSDCEVLLHGWRQWRERMFGKINGMFAVAIWDDHNQELILARDRLGIKPLYWRYQSGQFRFASEIKALLAKDCTWRISQQGLAQYLAMQNMVGSTTLFDGVEMVEPGHYIRYRNGRVEKNDFWRPAFTDGPSAFEDAVEAFSGISMAAVERHLMADLPASTYLSAGFDSGGVTALASRLSDRPIASYTGHFDAKGWYDEASGAASIASHVGVEHRTITIAPDDLPAHLDDLVWSLDEPRMGMGAFPQFMVAREIAKDHKFVLTGHGGDELFSGYPIFKVIQATASIGEMLRTLPTVRPSELPHFAYFCPHPWQSSHKGHGLPELYSPSRLRRLLRPCAMQIVERSNVAAEIGQYVDQQGDRYQRLLSTYLRVYLPGLLVVEDKISMAHSLESRTPLLDNDLVDLSLSVPAATKLDHGVLKAIPKQALRRLLPESLYSLPKRGFPTPLANWLRGPLRNWFEDRLNPDNSPLSTWMDGHGLRREIDGFLQSPTRHWRPLDEVGAHRMWMLLSLDSWQRGLKRRLGVELEI